MKTCVLVRQAMCTTKKEKTYWVWTCVWVPTPMGTASVARLPVPRHEKHHDPSIIHTCVDTIMFHIRHGMSPLVPWKLFFSRQRTFLDELKRGHARCKANKSCDKNVVELLLRKSRGRDEPWRPYASLARLFFPMVSLPWRLRRKKLKI